MLAVARIGLMKIASHPPATANPQSKHGVYLRRGETAMSSSLTGNGIAGEGEGIAKEKVDTADTPARPGINSLETPELGHQSHIDRLAEDSARRASNRQAHNEGDIFTK
jgi:hypothetical protein